MFHIAFITVLPNSSSEHFRTGAQDERSELSRHDYLDMTETATASKTSYSYTRYNDVSDIDSELGDLRLSIPATVE